MNQTIQAEIQNFMPQAISSGLFVSLATITQPPSGQGPTGNPPAGPYTPVSSLLTNIACVDAPPSMARIQATEMKDVGEIESKGMRHVLLSINVLTSLNWSAMAYRVVVDGIEYDLLGAENDSQNTQTRLDMQLVSI